MKTTQTIQPKNLSLGARLSTLQLAPRSLRYYSDSDWYEWLNQLTRGEIYVLQANLTEIKKVERLLLYKWGTHYWNIYGKHYLTFACGYFGQGWGYSLLHSINEMEELTGLEIIKEKDFSNCISAFSRDIFNIKEKSGEIKPFYKNGSHSCYNIEDIKKCLYRCIICGCVNHKQNTIYYSRICSECQAEIETEIIEINKRKEIECQKHERNQRQFQECRKLMGKSRRALREEDLNACKLLSKEFKRVAILH